MGVKARLRKRQERMGVTDDAVRILCHFCEIKDNCSRRARKERDEALGRMTKCTLTPNETKAKKHQKSRGQRAGAIRFYD